MSLYTLENDFQATVDNYGSTYTDTGIGTSVTSGTANNKGTAVSLISGASVTDDVFGISILFSGGSSNAAVRNFLADILVDPAGGSSWTTIINNLCFHGPSLAVGGYWFYFPLFIKNGSSIGVQTQCSNASTACRCAVRLYCRPSRPDSIKVGSIVETFGATTASSDGTAITPGTNAMGSYTASLGTTVHDLWWWQIGCGLNNATQSSVTYLFDAAADATTKVLLTENVMSSGNTSEQSKKNSMGSRLPYRYIKAGNTIYARAACIGTPDSGGTVVVYGLGG